MKDFHSPRHISSFLISSLLVALLVSAMTTATCKKVEIGSVQIKNPIPPVYVSIDQLIPDLSSAKPSSVFLYDCFTAQNPDIDFSFGLDEMWIDAQKNAFPIPFPELYVPASFEDPLELAFSFSEPLIIHHLHWPDALEDYSLSWCTGKLTMHFAFSEDLPFDKIFLHPFLSSFYLPDYLLVQKYSISDPSMHVEYKNGRNMIRFSNPGMWIPREGLDVSMNVSGISLKESDLQEDGTLSLRGTFSGSGVFLLYPDDARNEMGATYNGSLEISISISDVHFDKLQGHLKAELFEREKIVKVPFPRLQDETLDRYDKVSLLVDFQRDHSSDPLGPHYHIVQRFFSIGGTETRSSPAIGTSPGNICLYMPECDAWSREGIDKQSCPGLKDVFSILPDTVGVCVTCDGLSEILCPGRTDHFRYKSTWFIPLFFNGTDWGKEYCSLEYPIETLVDQAVPGSDMEFSGWYENRMPFAIECTPVFIDEEGTHYALESETFEISPNGSGTFSFHRFVGNGIQDDKFYIKLIFGVFDEKSRPLSSGQAVQIGFDKLLVKKYL